MGPLGHSPMRPGTRYKPPIPLLVLLLALLPNIVSSQSCPDSVVYLSITTEPMILDTPGYANGSYPANMSCHFVFRGSNVSSRIQVNVLNSDFEEPIFSTCEDFVSIRDGATVMAKELRKWCGRENPRFVSSTSDMMYVSFVSDGQVQLRGARLSISEFFEPGCSTSWRTTAELPFCYRLEMTPPLMTWVEAQNHCGLDGSNLLTITSQAEYDFVFDTFDRNQTNPWIGYNDAVTEGTFTSILSNEIAWPQPYPKVRNNKREFDCVYLDFGISEGVGYTTDSCFARHSYICKKNKDGTSLPNPAPRQALRRGTMAEVVDLTIWILIVIGFIVFIILAAILFKNCRKCLKKNSNRVDVANESRLIRTDTSQRAHYPAEPDHLHRAPTPAPRTHVDLSKSIGGSTNLAQPGPSPANITTQPTSLAPNTVPVNAVVHVEPAPSHNFIMDMDRRRDMEMLNSALANDNQIPLNTIIPESVEEEEEDEKAAVISPQHLEENPFSVNQGTSTQGIGHHRLPPLTIKETSTFQTGREESVLAKSKRARELFERPKMAILDNVSAISLDEFWNNSKS